jgi:uncharacterized protein (TIGR03067 family)
VSNSSTLRKLAGEWLFMSLEVDGEATPHDGSRLLIDGDRFRMESPGGNYDGVFTIDVDHEPARIDIEFVEGPEAGNRSCGIFTFDGNDLVLCLGLAGASRPKTFATGKGTGHALERLRRTFASGRRRAEVTGGTRPPVEMPGKKLARSKPAAAIDESAFALRTSALLDRMQGEWLPVSLITSGSALGPDMLAYVSRAQKGNETKVVAGAQTMVHALMKLDESVSPIAIDYLNVGRGPKTVTHGVLDWVGDDMRICMARAGDSRPSDFTCAPKSGRTLSQWRSRMKIAD